MRLPLRTFCAAILIPLASCAMLASGDPGSVLFDPTHPGVNLESPASYRVLFETTKGTFLMEVTREWAPRGADRFYNLARRGYFDGAHFFRVVPGFVVQFGLPADPALAAVWTRHRMQDDPVRESNRRGFVTYAMSGPDSRSTQVFINLVDNAPLDEQGFAPFGRIVEGMEVVESLYSGYGDGGFFTPGPDQTRILTEGAPYIEREFPLLDRIISARVQE